MSPLPRALPFDLLYTYIPDTTSDDTASVSKKHFILLVYTQFQSYLHIRNIDFRISTLVEVDNFIGIKSVMGGQYSCLVEFFYRIVNHMF